MAWLRGDTASARSAGPVGHLVQFYDRDEVLVEGVADRLAGALSTGGVAVVVATPEHHEAFVTRLRALGLDVAKAEKEGRLVALDAAATTQSFMVDGRPCPDRFDGVVGGVLGPLQAGPRPVSIFGEMVALLWAQGQVNAAIAVERLWNRLAEKADFSLLCAYSNDLLSADQHLGELDEMCQLHSAIVGTPPAPVRRAGTGRASKTFGLATDAPRAARQFVASTLAGWGADGLADDAALVVSELATNAVLHASSDFRVALSISSGSLRVAVADNSPTGPFPQEAPEAAISGRGLRVVSALARRWGTTPAADGKVVWAELGH